MGNVQAATSRAVNTTCRRGLGLLGRLLLLLLLLRLLRRRRLLLRLLLLIHDECELCR